MSAFFHCCFGRDLSLNFKVFSFITFNSAAAAAVVCGGIDAADNVGRRAWYL